MFMNDKQFLIASYSWNGIKNWKLGWVYFATLAFEQFQMILLILAAAIFVISTVVVQCKSKKRDTNEDVRKMPSMFKKLFLKRQKNQQWNLQNIFKKESRIISLWKSYLPKR